MGSSHNSLPGDDVARRYILIFYDIGGEKDDRY